MRSRVSLPFLFSLLLLVSAGCEAPRSAQSDGTDAAETTASPAPTAAAEVTPPPASDETTPDPTQLDGLKVARERSRSGYSRERFKHWSDLDEDGCNTRQEVLIEESLAAVTIGPQCTLVGGVWFSPYDGRETVRPRGFDIDHLVPLAEAWDSGAKDWSASKREAFANDLDHPDALIAVTAASNRSKSDQDPAEWLPPRREFWCTYATLWIEVKLAWQLEADEGEVDKLREVLDEC